MAPALPPAAAVTLARPGATPMITPCWSTDTILGALDFQARESWVRSFALEKGIAVRARVWPATIVAALGASSTRTAGPGTASNSTVVVSMKGWVPGTTALRPSGNFPTLLATR